MVQLALFLTLAVSTTATRNPRLVAALSTPALDDPRDSFSTVSADDAKTIIPGVPLHDKIINITTKVYKVELSDPSFLDVVITLDPGINGNCGVYSGGYLFLNVTENYPSADSNISFPDSPDPAGYRLLEAMMDLFMYSYLCTQLDNAKVSVKDTGSKTAYYVTVRTLPPPYPNILTGSDLDLLLNTRHCEEYDITRSYCLRQSQGTDFTGFDFRKRIHEDFAMCSFTLTVNVHNRKHFLRAWSFAGSSLFFFFAVLVVFLLRSTVAHDFMVYRAPLSMWQFVKDLPYHVAYLILLPFIKTIETVVAIWRWRAWRLANPGRINDSRANRAAGSPLAQPSAMALARARPNHAYTQIDDSSLSGGSNIDGDSTGMDDAGDLGIGLGIGMGSTSPSSIDAASSVNVDVEAAGNICRAGTSSNSSEASDEPACRICREGEDERTEPLLQPCGCTGSVRWVHRSCLDKWRRESARFGNEHNVSHCELCKQELKMPPLRDFLTHDWFNWSDGPTVKRLLALMWYAIVGIALLRGVGWFANTIISQVSCTAPFSGTQEEDMLSLRALLIGSLYYCGLAGHLYCAGYYHWLRWVNQLNGDVDGQSINLLMLCSYTCVTVAFTLAAEAFTGYLCKFLLYLVLDRMTWDWDLSLFVGLMTIFFSVFIITFVLAVLRPLWATTTATNVTAPPQDVDSDEDLEASAPVHSQDPVVESEALSAELAAEVPVNQPLLPSNATPPR